MDNSKITVRCYVTGVVQGVWFRGSTKQQAEQLGVTGWAKNLTDGRVEVIASGDENKVKALIDWLGQGPETAEVSHVEEHLVDYQPFTDFTIKR